MIGKKNFVLFLLIIPVLLNAQNEWPLQRWTEVRGTVNGQKLGTFVAGVPPNPNLPYKAAVSKSGSTSFFRLQSPTDTSAQLTITGENPLFGDLNNDGWLDVVTVRSISDYDTAYIFWGKASGLDLSNPLLIPNENRFDALRPKCIGDINNDGKSDLVITAQAYPSMQGNGKVYVFLNPIVSHDADFTLVGDSILAGLGAACAIADLDADGRNDLIVRGWRGGVSSRDDYINIYWNVSRNPLKIQIGLQLRGYYLYSLGLGCFDVNGDGLDDLLWINRDAGSDWIFIHYGGKWFSKTPDLRLRNPGVPGLGRGIVNGGDLNGDGYDDILVTAPDATITSGFVFVFSGGKALDSKFDGAVGFSTDAKFGWSTASVGDINGDDLADIIVGAPEYDFSTNKGYWGVFLGSRNIPTNLVEKNTPSIDINLYQNYPNPFNPNTTIEFSLPRTERVILKIYDTAGREIAKLVDEEVPAGHHWTTWNGRDANNNRVPSGTYFVSLVVGDSLRSRKLLLLK